MHRIPHRLCFRAGLLLLAFWGLGTALAQGLPGDAATSGRNAVPAIELRFRDFFRMPIGAAGVQMTDTLLAADGRRVRVTGYMVTQERPLRGHFFLTPVPVTMSVHADGEADDLPAATVLVQMPAVDRELPLLRTRGLLQLSGTLHVGRHEMADGRVVWVRLALEPRPEVAATLAP